MLLHLWPDLQNVDLFDKYPLIWQIFMSIGLFGPKKYPSTHGFLCTGSFQLRKKARLCIGWNQSPHVGRQKYWAEHEKRWPRPFARSWHWASTEQNNCHCATHTSQSPPFDKPLIQKLRKHGLLFVWMYLHLVWVFILRYCTAWHIHWQKSTTRRQRRSSGGGWWWWRMRCWRWGKSWSTRPLKGGGM